MKIALFKNISYFVSNDMKLLFYNAYILPIFDYGCTIWGKGNTSYIKKVHTLQRRICKLILKKPTRTPSAGLFRELHWLSFSDRCKYHAAVLVYKTLHNMAPEYMSEILTFSSNDNYSLRSISNNDLVLLRTPRTNIYKDTFSYYTVNIWNHIPIDIRNSSNLQMFKGKYKQYLLGI